MKRIITTKGLAVSLFIAIVLSWCFSACSKNNEKSEPRMKTVVHIVGTIEKENKVLANYWKDGVVTNLNAGEDYVWANAVATDGKSIYVGGMMVLGGANYTPVYWKDGVLTKLADETKDIKVEAITVVGGNVHVAGTDYSGANNKAVYIKSGEAPVAISDGTVSAHGYSIAVVGSKVYTVGVVDGEIATLWEGKTAITLPLLDGMTRSEAHAIVAVGNKLYIAGFSGSGVGSGDPRPTLWIKDGTNPITIQALEDDDAEAYGLAVVGNDVYVAGVDLSGTKPAAVYWKNGQKQHISDNAIAYGIAVEGDDIYVVGTEEAVESKAKLWKNGVATVLWEGGFELPAKSIVLTKEVY